MEKTSRGDTLHDTEAEVAALIAAQHGVVSRRQALGAGMTETMIHRRLATGRWTQLWRGVYSPMAVPESWEKRLMGACLAGGPLTVASHRSAGALWKFDGRPSGIVEVTIDGSGVRKYRGVVVHRTRELEIVDRTTVDGIPVTRPARTLIDLAAVVDGEGLEMAVDSALRDRHVSIDYLDRRLADLGSRGRDGVELLRALVDDRRGGKPADSQAENKVRCALAEAGLPQPVRQFELAGVATFDLAYPDRRIGIEFESYQFHANKRQWRRDQARHNKATALGWLVFHLTADLDVAPIVHAYRNRPAA